jgi:putative DNA primase/helicase
MTAATLLLARVESAETYSPPIEAVTLGDFLRRDFPPREMLLAPWMPVKGIALAFAPRGIGKTHFALGTAYAVASGGEFLKWAAPKPRKVLVIDGEMPAIALKERWQEIVDKSPMEPPSEDYVRLLCADICEAGLPDLSTVEGQQKIEPFIGDAELIIVDNLSTLCRSGKENESESWGIVQAWALQQRRAGRSVLFIHHAGKGGEQRGTSKREDVLDSVVKLSLPEDYGPSDGARFVVAFTKSRGFYGADAEPFEAGLRDGVWSIKDIEDGLAEQAHQLALDGMTQRKIGNELNCSAAKVNRLIARYKEKMACR